MLNATTRPPVPFGHVLAAGAFRLFLALFGPRVQAVPRRAQPAFQAQRLYPIGPERAHLYARAADEAWG